MKKTFFLIIISLTLILSYFVVYYLYNNSTSNIDIEINTTLPENSQNCTCESECLCKKNNTECDCSKTKSTCSCKDKTGKTIIIESIEPNDSNVEELNPDMTSDEGETILSE